MAQPQPSKEPAPSTPPAKDTGFFETINRSALAVNRSAAGAGIVGVVGFLGIGIVAAVFFVTENFFISFLLLSLGMLVYATGAEVGKLLLSSVTIFFSSKHLTPQAAQLQETLVALQDVLSIRRDREGKLKVGPIDKGTRIRLPDNSLVRDIQSLLEKQKDYEYAEYVVHSYFVECHEMYDHSNSHLDFVSGVMPLFGLMGTVLGLIAMFDSLGSVVTVQAIAPQFALALKTTLYGALLSSAYKIVATRFENRLKGLGYDYETICLAIKVLIENKAVVEVQK